MFGDSNCTRCGNAVYGNGKLCDSCLDWVHYRHKSYNPDGAGYLTGEDLTKIEMGENWLPIARQRGLIYDGVAPRSEVSNLHEPTPKPPERLDAGIGGGSAKEPTARSRRNSPAIIKMPFDGSEPVVVSNIPRLIARIDSETGGLRVKLLRVDSTSIEMEIRDERNLAIEQFQREVQRLRERLAAAVKSLHEHRELLREKDSQIEKLLDHVAGGSGAYAKKIFAVILFLDVAGTSTMEEPQKSNLLSLLWNAGALLADRHRIYMRNSFGDGLVFAFENPNAALSCAFGLSQTLRGLHYQARAALTHGRVNLQRNPMRDAPDIVGYAVDEGARLEPAIKQLDHVDVLASAEFRNLPDIDENLFEFKECQVTFEKSQGNHSAGDLVTCFQVIDKRN
ncbi:MAG TPA: hypothetical protein VMI56_04170 [Reyranella sp.]|nr:hypothetical protein [Reyranella sp.]